ncbi:hypothetical protein IIF7_02821 [Zunongwangia atlantica 22II14-10F7]|uniref:Uncharacterized protein n=2 Tax=Zunongwangia TaxID=417127 RepID=A0A1Y1T786_9FLAO|nr:hypothetical protein IIF7_02821 [Zunongwangia atlantica 22II14-10F7]
MKSLIFQQLFLYATFLNFLHLIRNQLNIMIKKLSILALVMLLFSCSDNDTSEEIDLAVYSDFQEIEEEDYMEILANSLNIDGMAQVLIAENGDQLITFQYGTCTESPNSYCASLENTDPGNGFKKYVGLYGYDCHDYLVVSRNGNEYVINTEAEFVDLVGEVDTLAKALFLVWGRTYRTDYNNIEVGAYRETTAGYEFIATKLMSDCLPILTNRFNLLVKRNGQISIEAEEEYSRNDDMCI